MVKTRCPVPPEQLPINQYQDISESWFYSWGSRKQWLYFKPLLILWCVSWAVTGPVAASSFAPGKYPIPFVVWSSVGAFLLPILSLVQLYMGWLHVGQRLERAEVPYEESGWYDGQVWLKPEEDLNRDRLIMMYEVQPVLRRARNTLGVLIAVGVALVGAGQFL